MADTRNPTTQRARAPRLLAALAAAVLVLPACRTRVPAPPAAAAAALPASPTAWTTPRDWNEVPAGRLERAPEAAPARLDLDGEIGVFSKYVWRGQRVTDDPVLQPAATLGYGGWSFVAWGNLDLTDVNGDAMAFSEIDLLLEHRHDIGGATLLAGVGWYTFPSLSFPDTLELYAGITLDAPLSPGVTLYYDVDAVDGIYASLAVSEDVRVGAGTLALAASLGWGDDRWNDFAWGVASEGFNDLLLRATWTWTAGCWTIKPIVAWSVLLDGDVRAAAASREDWIFGLTIGLSP